MPSYEIEVDHPTDRPNLSQVQVGPALFWFSYRTIVAFTVPGQGRIVCDNVWSKTTGKHLNYIDGGDKEGRIKQEVFEARLAEVLAAISISIPNFEPLPTEAQVGRPQRRQRTASPGRPQRTGSDTAHRYVPDNGEVEEEVADLVPDITARLAAIDDELEGGKR